MNARTLAAAAFVVSLGVLYWFFAGGIVREPAAPQGAAGPPARTAEPPRAPPHRARSSEAPAAPAAGEGVVVRVVAKETKAPVAGASVTLFEDDVPPRDATTDASGVARVPGTLGEGGGRVRVRAAGFATKDGGADSDGVTVEMERGVAVDGVVTETDGRPIAGAHVVHRRGGDDEDCLAGGYPPLAEATTGADGTFRLEGLRADREAKMTVSAARHVAKSGTWDPAAPARVEIRLDRGGRITGVVLDAGRAPAAGASVYAYPSEPNDVPDDTPIVDSVETDASGRFEIDGVPLVGAWTVEARKDGFANALPGAAVVDAAHPESSCDLLLRPLARIEVVVVDAAGAPVEEGTVSYSTPGQMAGVKLEPDGRCMLEIAEPGACRIKVETARHPFFETDATCASGETTPLRIELAEGVAIAGVVVDDLGRAVPQAKVEVQGHVGRDGRWFDRATTSGDDGAFRVAGLGAQKYAVKASARNHEMGTIADVVAPADGVRVVLGREGRASLRLRVPAGTPTPGTYSVTFVGRDERRTETFGGDWGDGSVSISLSPGRWFALVQIDGFVHTAHPLEVSPGAESQLGEIVLERGGVLRGTVRDAAGKPSTDVRVEVSLVGDSSGAPFLPVVDDHGEFTDRKVAGRYRVVVTRGETTLATREVDLRDGEETKIEIVIDE